jgi:hypothetical protein
LVSDLETGGEFYMPYTLDKFVDVLMVATDMTSVVNEDFPIKITFVNERLMRIEIIASDEPSSVNEAINQWKAYAYGSAS